MKLSLVLAITISWSALVSGAIVRDAETLKTREDFKQFCKGDGKAKRKACEDIRQELFLSVKAKAFKANPCGPTIQANKLIDLYPGNSEAAALAKRIATTSKGNFIKGRKKADGTKDDSKNVSLNNKGKKGFVGTGVSGKCDSVQFKGA